METACAIPNICKDSGIGAMVRATADGGRESFPPSLLPFEIYTAENL